MTEQTRTGRWPALEYEEHHWYPSDPDALSRRARLENIGPYPAAVVPPIAERSVPIPSPLATEAEEAAVEISRFDGEASQMLREREIAPIEAVLMRSESAASSQIENLTVGARQLALAELGIDASANAKMVSANVSAMRAAVELAGRISIDTILQMHAALMQGQRGHTGGTWRTEQVWIGGTSKSPLRASFVPPHHQRVPAAMADLVSFAGRTDLPALPHAAIAHAQFETIHPFTDGNGRTGRALIHAMVRAAGLARRVTVPLSAGLLVDTEQYIDALTAYREGDVAPIIGQINTATFRSVANGRQLLGDLREIHQQWQSRITRRRGSASWRAIDLLIGQPVVTVGYVQTTLGVASFHTAQGAIDHLEELGILTPAVQGRRRNRTWYAREVLDALDAFAERAGRRG